MAYYIIILTSAEKEFQICSTREPISCWQKHNAGYYADTKLSRPWDLVYVEILESKTEIFKRKKILKDLLLEGLNRLNSEHNIVHQILIYQRHFARAKQRPVMPKHFNDNILR